MVGRWLPFYRIIADCSNTCGDVCTVACATSGYHGEKRLNIAAKKTQEISWISDSNPRHRNDVARFSADGNVGGVEEKWKMKRAEKIRGRGI